MHLIAFLLIFLATLENLWPLIVGFQGTPEGYVFLGTVHHPPDYFYYLSQFAQGGYRWVTTVDLFTSEQIPATFVGWSNVLTGRIFQLFGLSPFVAYHTSVAILTVLLFVFAYKLTRSTLALYLFALFHAFPILRDGKPSYGDYWNNFAVPRVRFGGVPHQLLLNTASMALVYFLIECIQNKQKTGKTLIGLGISSLILASLQPVLWALITAISVVTALCKPVSRHTGLPFLIMLVCGLPPVLYLTRLFITLPFSQLKLWEAGAQNAFTPEHFLTSTGPVFLIALFSLPLFASHLSFAKIFVILFSLLSLLLFLSPVPIALGLSQARFISTLTILCLSVVASSGLMHLINAKGNIMRIIGALLIVGISWLLIPNHFKTLRLVSQFNPGNAYYYLPAAEYEFLQRSGRIGTPEDTFLVTWPYNEMFPAITGKRTYYGHPLLTIRQEEKAARAVSLFTGTLTPAEMAAFLTENHITYIITTADNPRFASLSFLIRVAASKTLILYQVKRE